MIRLTLCIILCMFLCGCAGSFLQYCFTPGQSDYAGYYTARTNIPKTTDGDGSTTIIDRSNRYTGSYNGGGYSNYGAYTGAISKSR